MPEACLQVSGRAAGIHSRAQEGRCPTSAWRTRPCLCCACRVALSLSKGSPLFAGHGQPGHTQPWAFLFLANSSLACPVSQVPDTQPVPPLGFQPLLLCSFTTLPPRFVLGERWGPLPQPLCASGLCFYCGTLSASPITLESYGLRGRIHGLVYWLHLQAAMVR